jgi:sugar phosphate isomerase/epimerase
MPNPLTFSTLACPEWSREEVIEQAKAMGYDGLEWRGGPQGHVPFSMTAEERRELKRQVAEAGLVSLAVTAYSSFVSESASERRANVESLNRSSDLAAEIGATFVRAFLGEVSEGQPVDEALQQTIADCLTETASYAQSVGVTIAVEPHDSFVRSESVLPILNKAPHPALEVIWDVGNTFGAGEEAEESIALLGRRLAYVQVKDGTGRGNNWTLGPVGQGQVQLKRIIEMLLGAGYKGAFSVEWERAWHPELDPAAVALPEALRVMRGFISRVKQ